MGVYVIVCVLNIGVTSGWSKILNYKYFKSYSNIPYSHIPINYMKSQLLMDTNCCRGKPVGHTHPWLTPHGYTVMTALTLN